MSFDSAVRGDNFWTLRDVLGYELRLPCAPTYHARRVTFGLLGTGTEGRVRGRGGKTDAVAKMLVALRQSITLIDTRRSGVGGRGSWSPKEFATKIPELMGPEAAYAYFHLPCLAPTIALRERKLGWREFDAAYTSDLSPGALQVARAFVEAATGMGGMAVFLCAEPFAADFAERSYEAQCDVHCHRFMLGELLRDELRRAWPSATVEVLALDMADAEAQLTATGAYAPPVWR